MANSVLALRDFLQHPWKTQGSIWLGTMNKAMKVSTMERHGRQGDQRELGADGLREGDTAGRG